MLSPEILQRERRDVGTPRLPDEGWGLSFTAQCSALHFPVVGPQGQMSETGPLSQVTSRHRGWGGCPISCLYNPDRNFWSWPSRLESSSHGNKWSVPLSKTPASPTTCTLPPSSARMVRWPHGLCHPQLWDSRVVSQSHFHMGLLLRAGRTTPMFAGCEREQRRLCPVAKPQTGPEKLQVGDSGGSGFPLDTEGCVGHHKLKTSGPCSHW